MSYYVTTPIYYVNGEPHLGHAYTTIAADVLARHMRQRGEDVFFLTGTDEHGEPVTQAAEAIGITPRELGDRHAVRFKELAATLNVTNDFFIRTTDPEHMAKVGEVVQRIHDNGHVYAGTYEGWYCPRCADFKTESELEDGSRHSRSRSSASTRSVPSSSPLATATTRRCPSSRAACATSH
jgi:methionyl-tRNA synthetase